MNRHKVAIMQPYFFPYLGYFRLLSQVDTFVVLDTVQFPRSGWVHRNQFSKKRSGEPGWWNIPLIKQPVASTMIEQLLFDFEHLKDFEEKYTSLEISNHKETLELFPQLLSLKEFRVIEYLQWGIQTVSEILGLKPKIVLASSLENRNGLRGENRIISICQALSATEYLNAPGGKGLYSQENFTKAGIELNILSPFMGNHKSVLERIVTENLSRLKDELNH